LFELTVLLLIHAAVFEVLKPFIQYSISNIIILPLNLERIFTFR
jgi:hypothetical protein